MVKVPARVTILSQLLLILLMLPSCVRAFVHDNPECGEPFHCPDECVITWYGKCPSNCYCKPIRRCESVKCPHPPPRCIIVTTQEGCQRCACEDDEGRPKFITSTDDLQEITTQHVLDTETTETIATTELRVEPSTVTTRTLATVLTTTEARETETEQITTPTAQYPRTLYNNSSTRGVDSRTPETTTEQSTRRPETTTRQKTQWTSMAETVTTAEKVTYQIEVTTGQPTWVTQERPKWTVERTTEQPQWPPPRVQVTTQRAPWTRWPAEVTTERAAVWTPRPVSTATIQPISQLPAEIRTNHTIRKALEEYARKICTLQYKKVIDDNFKALFTEIGLRLSRANVYPSIFSFPQDYLMRKCNELKDANRRTPLEVRRSCFRKYYVFDELISLLSYPCSLATRDQFFGHFGCIQSAVHSPEFSSCLPKDVDSIVRYRVRALCSTFGQSMPCMQNAVTRRCSEPAWATFKQYLIIRLLKLDPSCKMTQLHRL